MNKFYLGHGPKCLAYGNTWRIEEFILDSCHPDPKLCKTFKYRRLIAIYIARFHKARINLKHSEPMIKKIIETGEMLKDFENKVK